MSPRLPGRFRKARREGVTPSFSPPPGSYSRRYPTGSPTQAGHGHAALARSGHGRSSRSPAPLHAAVDESALVTGPQPPPQWNNPRAPSHSIRLSPPPAPRGVRQQPRLFTSPAPNRGRSNTPTHTGRSSLPAASASPAQRHGVGGPQPLAPAGAASAFACSPFALVPPASAHAWPRQADVPRLFLSRNVPPTQQPPQEQPLYPPPAIGPPNSLETLNAAHPQRVAMKSTPEEPAPPLPKDPLTSFNSHKGGIVNDDDLFRGGRALVPSSMDSVSTRDLAQTHRSLMSARGHVPPVATAPSAEVELQSTSTVNPYLPLYPGAHDRMTVSDANRGIPVTTSPPTPLYADPLTGSAAAAGEGRPEGRRDAGALGSEDPMYASAQMRDMVGKVQYSKSVELSQAAAALGCAHTGLSFSSAVAAAQADPIDTGPLTTTIDTIDRPAAGPLDTTRLEGPSLHSGPRAGRSSSGRKDARSASHSGSTVTHGSDACSKEPAQQQPGVATASLKLALQSLPGCESGAERHGRAASDSPAPMHASDAARPSMYRLSASTAKPLHGHAPGMGPNSTPPTSGPPSSSLGSPTSLEQLLPSRRHGHHQGLSEDGQPSVGNLATMTFSPSKVGSNGALGNHVTASNGACGSTSSAVPDLSPLNNPAVPAGGTKPGNGEGWPPVPDDVSSAAGDQGDALHQQPHPPAAPNPQEPHPAAPDAGSASVGAWLRVLRDGVEDEEASGDTACGRRCEVHGSGRKLAAEAGQTQRVKVYAAELGSSSDAPPQRSSSSVEMGGDEVQLRPRGVQKPRRLFSVCCMAPQETHG